jgi:putative ABC transport system permease protein
MLHRLGWYQLISEKRRLLAAIAGVTFAVLLQMMQFGFRDALYTSATVIHSRLQADLLLISPHFDYMLSTGTIPRRRLYQARERPEVQSVAPVYLGLANVKNPDSGENRQIFVIAFNPDHVILDEETVIQRAAVVKTPDVALFDALSRPNNFGTIADDVRRNGAVLTEVNGRRMKIGGVFELGPSFSAPGHLIVSDATFRRLFGRSDNVFELGLIRLKPGSDVEAVRATLARTLPPDVQVVTRQQFIDREQAFWARNSPVGFIFLAGSLVGLFVGAVIIYQILYTDITDHLSQYATLKAMGYADRHLYFVVFQQAFLLSIFGFPLGLALAEVVYALARDATHLPIVMTGQRVLIVLALTVGMSAASCLIAMRKLQKADPAECF